MSKLRVLRLNYEGPGIIGDGDPSFLIRMVSRTVEAAAFTSEDVETPSIDAVVADLDLQTGDCVLDLETRRCVIVDRPAFGQVSLVEVPRCEASAS